MNTVYLLFFNLKTPDTLHSKGGVVSNLGKAKC